MISPPTTLRFRSALAHPALAVLGLSPREIDVFERVAVGKKLSKIADELGISVKTVWQVKRNLCEKLNFDNVGDDAHISFFAFKQGWVYD